jgi:hypothetical protein
MLDLLDMQRQAHDLVLLDAPPATVSDVLSLASQVDGVVVLAREGYTRGRDVAALRHRLDQFGTPVLGGVLIGTGRINHRRRSAARPVADYAPPRAWGASRPAPDAKRVQFDPASRSSSRPLASAPGDTGRSVAPPGAMKRPR